MNTFVSTTTGFSPYKLEFLKKPPDILNLYFEPLETIAKCYRGYCLKMRTKLDNVSSFITELKSFQQQRQALEKSTQAKKPEVFKKGQLVYLFAPSVVSLQTNTKKCCTYFVGPLVINRVLDETHYILSDLKCRILCGVYHVRRLKKAQLRTPIGNVTTYDELKTTFQETDADNMLPNISDAALAQSLVALIFYKQSPVQNCNVLNTCVHVLYYKYFIVDICEDNAIAPLWQLVQNISYFIIFYFIHIIQLHLIM